MVECGEEPEIEEEEFDREEKQILLKTVLGEPRHLENIEPYQVEAHCWRLKDRMKTVSVALVLCLNLPVDPPDVVKLQPCARMEAWVDPQVMPPRNAIEAIGNNLQKAYERWQPKARYKCSRDPTGDEIKKLCLSLRRNAKEERVLFHYNGHGVPRPTDNGEIWVFNSNYTQYIPLYIYDLQQWMGTPSIYVYDCSHAGKIVNLFKSFSNQDDGKCIQLAACGEKQLLPMNPDLPADLFTSCLTTPVKMAIKYYMLQNKERFLPGLTPEMLDKIPGLLSDRRSMLGELNWIFTAITDTIAWNTLPRDIFQKLFRQDLLVASLFRNFLLAQRVMRSYNCTPVSSPSLPSTHQHHMWGAWDLALELSLSQLPRILTQVDPASAYRPSPFFEEQLTSFQVWLNLGSVKRAPPEQLPIVLQVLLSQVYRPRALELLGTFLGLGPWAVNLVLEVGIFPYILKLLQSTAKELRPLLTLLWAKILAVDPQCKSDLIRENGNKYFSNVLKKIFFFKKPVEYRSMAAFVMCSLVSENHHENESSSSHDNILPLCLELLHDDHPPLRQWSTMCAARAWDQHPKARWEATRDNAPDKLLSLLDDKVPEVRAAAAYALGTFIKSLPLSDRTDQGRLINHKIAVNLKNKIMEEASPLVRQEILVALHYVMLFYEGSFREVVRQFYRESSEMGYDMLSPRIKTSVSSLSHEHMYLKVWQCFVSLENDPYPKVAKLARSVTSYLRNRLMNTSQEGSDIRIKNNETPDGKHLSGTCDDTSIKNKNLVLGHSTVESDQFVNPVITTKFWGWSSNFFMKSGEAKDNEFNVSSEAVSPEDKSARSSHPIHSDVKWTLGLQKLEDQLFMTKNQDQCDFLLFHPTESLLILGHRSHVAIWDYEKDVRVNFWENSNNAYVNSSITSMTVINSGKPLCYLCVGSNDGTVKVWNNAFRAVDNRFVVSRSRTYSNSKDLMDGDVMGNPTLITAFTALEEISYIKKDAAQLVMSWEQESTCLVAGGNSDKIRLWDLNTEKKITDISSKSNSVSALHSQGSWIASGFTDGYLRLFDRRITNPLVREWKDGSSPIITTQLFNSSSTSAHIISGATSGEVRLYDLRRNGSVQVRQPGHKISSMSCHTKAHLFAVGSYAQQISVHHTSGSSVNSIKYFNGLMGQKLGPVHTSQMFLNK
ncbi:Regulatory-associated protein of mTOR [Armadillidium vulgare]|nr:Regulatory-associated protein of mTOR [Armadillidium vulgare]